MQITPDQRNQLDEHLSGQEGRWDHHPPWAVYAAVATLVDPDDIKACYSAATSSDGSTCWSIWIVTSVALAQFEVEFDAAEYGAARESDRLDRSPPEIARAKISKATVDRRLADVVKVELVPHSDHQTVALTNDPDGAIRHQQPGRNTCGPTPTRVTLQPCGRRR
jgi:hypothetical protein